jgi:hypothetical protein
MVNIVFFLIRYFHLGFHLDTRPRPIIPINVLLLDKVRCEISTALTFL